MKTHKCENKFKRAKLPYLTESIFIKFIKYRCVNVDVEAHSRNYSSFAIRSIL